MIGFGRRCNRVDFPLRIRSGFHSSRFVYFSYMTVRFILYSSSGFVVVVVVKPTVGIDSANHLIDPMTCIRQAPISGVKYGLQNQMQCNWTAKDGRYAVIPYRPSRIGMAAADRNLCQDYRMIIHSLASQIQIAVPWTTGIFELLHGSACRRI